MAKKTEKVCIHCGEKVSADVEICPSCGLNVEAVSYVSETGTNDSGSEKNEVTSNDVNRNSKRDIKNILSFNSKSALIAGLAVFLIVAVIVALVLTNKGTGTTDSNTKGAVTSKEDIKQKFDVEIKDPVDANDISYVVESVKNKSDQIVDIPKLTYKKTVSDGQVMDFILRVASSTEDIENSIGLTDSKGEDVEFAYTPIMMTVICEDGSEVPVESKVALDDTNQEMRYMRALWFDNDKYYSMVTDNLYTREDFLQEVNRVIISNHEVYEDGEAIEVNNDAELKEEVDNESQSKVETNN